MLKFDLECGFGFDFDSDSDSDSDFDFDFDCLAKPELFFNS